jgi:hypothetical protein
VQLQQTYQQEFQCCQSALSTRKEPVPFISTHDISLRRFPPEITLRNSPTDIRNFNLINSKLWNKRNNFEEFSLDSRRIINLKRRTQGQVKSNVKCHPRKARKTSDSYLFCQSNLPTWAKSNLQVSTKGKCTE